MFLLYIFPCTSLKNFRPFPSEIGTEAYMSIDISQTCTDEFSSALSRVPSRSAKFRDMTSRIVEKSSKIASHS